MSVDQATTLRNVIEQRKDELKEKLINIGYYKTPDGKQLYELSLEQLEAIYEAESKCTGDLS